MYCSLCGHHRNMHLTRKDGKTECLKCNQHCRKMPTFSPAHARSDRLGGFLSSAKPLWAEG